ncbi:MAG: NUDIX hydrolase, partial [Planctomycetota bacterium]
MPQLWKVSHSQIVGHHRIFRVREDTVIRPWDQQPQNFVVLECPDWVNVIPINSKKEVLFVRQFRHGIKAVTLEIPGGMLDPEDTSPEVAATRELLEETGAIGTEWISLGSCSPNPAFQDNRCHHFLAMGTAITHNIAPDSNEQFTLEWIPLEKINDYITAGKIIHSLVIAAFFALER